MNKDLYKNEIIDQWVDDDEDLETTNHRYKELSKIMDPMYDFILAYSYYYSTRRYYGSTDIKLTMIEVHILTDIYDNPGITVSQLATQWNRTTSAISQSVRKLIKWDLVYRKNSPTDGKVYNLYTTEKGEELSINHKKYDNVDIIKTRKRLLKEFSVEELVAFDNVARAYTALLRDEDN